MPELTIDAFERDGGKFKQGEEKMEEEIVQQVERDRDWDRQKQRILREDTKK